MTPNELAEIVAIAKARQQRGVDVLPPQNTMTADAIKRQLRYERNKEKGLTANGEPRKYRKLGIKSASRNDYYHKRNELLKEQAA